MARRRRPTLEVGEAGAARQQDVEQRLDHVLHEVAAEDGRGRDHDRERHRARRRRQLHRERGAGDARASGCRRAGTRAPCARRGARCARASPRRDRSSGRSGSRRGHSGRAAPVPAARPGADRSACRATVRTRSPGSWAVSSRRGRRPRRASRRSGDPAVVNAPACSPSAGTARRRAPVRDRPASRGLVVDAVDPREVDVPVVGDLVVVEDHQRRNVREHAPNRRQHGPEQPDVQPGPRPTTPC